MLPDRCSSAHLTDKYLRACSYKPPIWSHTADAYISSAEAGTFVQPMTPDSTPVPPATPTGTAPTTPFTSPTGHPVQNTPDSGYGNDDDADSTTTLGPDYREGIEEYGRSYHRYNAGRKYLSLTIPSSILSSNIANGPFSQGYYFPNDEVIVNRITRNSFPKRSADPFP